MTFQKPDPLYKRNEFQAQLIYCQAKSSLLKDGIDLDSLPRGAVFHKPNGKSLGTSFSRSIADTCTS